MGNFKKLRVWQDGLALVTNIYQESRKGDFAKDYALGDQIRRAAISIPSNIAEGEERGYEKEARRFFNIAKGSCAELITQLYFAYNIGYINQDQLGDLENHAERINASLKNLIKARGL